MLPPLKPVLDIEREELFAASYVKLARAQKFIGELEAERQRYRDSKPVTGKFEVGSNPPAMNVHWKGITLLPGAIIGDTIHNLRTALDLMASELARIRKEPDKDVYFPFAESASRFEHAIKSKQFNKAGDDAVALLRTFSPYRGGNESLRALHDMDISDKHTALVPTGSVMDISVKGWFKPENLSEHSFDVDCTSLDYIFPDESSFPRKPVIETLKDLMQLVHGIIEAFAALVKARS
jgi:hypothetical protein